ncbi:hypothetical protein BpHYR1_023981 [Brachionus plicatilis]|uniref:Uncharacterized protein n=1 Tax=Brachionus plicatilis TaxID=10195 RepID=A0A3M7SHD6_BRAPC|nr:hypothetical protein BpHYR1_023981 [Brachionus plicatilis]
MTDCGLDGRGGRRSMITFLGGGGIRLPEMVITFRPSGTGADGGASRMTKGSGVSGRAGCWRMMSGGAGAVTVLGSWLIMISPGLGGVGGLKYLMASSWTYSKL